MQSTADRIWNKLRRCYWLSFSYFYLLFNKYFSVCVCVSVSLSHFLSMRVHRIVHIQWIGVCMCERANASASAYMCVLAHIIFPSFAFVHLFIWCFEDLLLLTNRNKSNNTTHVGIYMLPQWYGIANKNTLSLYCFATITLAYYSPETNELCVLFILSSPSSSSSWFLLLLLF